MDKLGLILKFVFFCVVTLIIVAFTIVAVFPFALITNVLVFVFECYKTQMEKYSVFWNYLCDEVRTTFKKGD